MGADLTETLIFLEGKLSHLSVLAKGGDDITRAVSEKFGLERMINTAVLGAYCRLTDILPLQELLSAIETMIPTRKNANLEAARQAHSRITIYEPST